MTEFIRTPAELVEAGLIPNDRAAALERVAQVYAMRLSPQIVSLIDRNDPADPLARQFVPHESELEHAPEELADPIGDEAHERVRGLVHRYPDRVLLKPVLACPVYCRFCFRRETVGRKSVGMSPAELDQAYDYIRARPEIFEVILTGGDPFILAPRRIAGIVGALSGIDHVGVIRFHTRVPVVEPERIERRLLQALETEKGLFVAIHSNHPRELGHEAAEAIRRLARSGAALLGQTVLLSGVNDDPAVLAALFRRMAQLRVKPYYLHHGDLAPGTARFRCSIEHGRDLMRALRGRLSGICQPTYVLDLPGGFGKVPIGPDYLEPGGGPGSWVVTDYQGAQHRYPPEQPGAPGEET